MKTLTLYAEDSLANHSVELGSEEARRMTAISGRKCLGSSKKLDPLGYLEKMLLTSPIWNSTERYLTWKVSVTDANRLLYRLVPSMPNTEGTEPSSWPTPTVADTYTDKLKSTQQKTGSMHSLSLSQAARLWPTPNAWDGNRGPLSEEQVKKGENQITLTTAVKHWITPTASDGKRANFSVESLKKSKETGNLSQQIAHQEDGQLNPQWVEWLMGFPEGWTDLED